MHKLIIVSCTIDFNYKQQINIFHISLKLPGTKETLALVVFCSDIDISKHQMPKKISTVAKEATILDHEVKCCKKMTVTVDSIASL